MGMDLEYWLIENNLSQSDFAKKLEINRTHLNRLVRRRTAPSKKLAIRIQQLTQGGVSAIDMLFPPPLPELEQEINKRREQEQKDRDNEKILNP